MAMTPTYFNTVHRMTTDRALLLAKRLRDSDPTSVAHLTDTEQALIRLAWVRLPAHTIKRRLSALRREVRILRRALQAQSLRVHGVSGDLQTTLEILSHTLVAVRKASNSIPCTQPACDLCRWITKAGFRTGGIRYRHGPRLERAHALEASLHESDLA